MLTSSYVGIRSYFGYLVNLLLPENPILPFMKDLNLNRLFRDYDDWDEFEIMNAFFSCNLLLNLNPWLYSDYVLRVSRLKMSVSIYQPMGYKIGDT